jgi:outer membrane protein assembly factor BamA
MSRRPHLAATLLLALPLSLPAADDQLQLRDTRIGRIDVQVQEIFEQDSLSVPYRLANDLHISTREQTVLQQLLFRSGDTYDPRLIDEAARLLRAQRYLSDATITPLHYNDDNTVDVLVKVHDVWTLNPGLSLSRKGGENSTRFKVEDTNFLGLGKQITLARSSDVDRTAWRLAYADPNVFGSRWTLASAYSSMSDGAEKALVLQRPFYSLDSRWSANLAGLEMTSTIPRYSLGQRVERINMQEQSFDIGGGVSAGLKNGWTKRYLAGLRYESRSFERHPDEPDAALPENRVLAYPWIGMEVIEDEYVSTRNLDQIGRTEDLYLGRSARIEAGLAASAFGSTRAAVVLRGSLQAGADLGRERYLINTLGIDSRVEAGELANATFELNSRYYQRHSTRRVFFASIAATVGSKLDPEEQLLLGGDNGLRGYPLRYQAGSSSALVTLEERFYTDWQPLKLVNVGAAVFVDTGRTWGRDAFAAAPQGWLTDVGVGLRLGNARSGLGNVIHVDLAFPLNGGSDLDSVQLLIETRKSF